MFNLLNKAVGAFKSFEKTLKGQGLTRSTGIGTGKVFLSSGTLQTFETPFPEEWSNKRPSYPLLPLSRLAGGDPSGGPETPS